MNGTCSQSCREKVSTQSSLSFPVFRLSCWIWWCVSTLCLPLDASCSSPGHSLCSDVWSYLSCGCSWLTLSPVGSLSVQLSLCALCCTWQTSFVLPEDAGGNFLLGEVGFVLSMLKQWCSSQGITAFLQWHALGAVTWGEWLLGSFPSFPGSSFPQGWLWCVTANLRLSLRRIFCGSWQFVGFRRMVQCVQPECSEGLLPWHITSSVPTPLLNLLPLKHTTKRFQSHTAACHHWYFNPLLAMLMYFHFVFQF